MIRKEYNIQIFSPIHTFERYYRTDDMYLLLSLFAFLSVYNGVRVYIVFIYDIVHFMSKGIRKKVIK